MEASRFQCFLAVVLVRVDRIAVCGHSGWYTKLCKFLFEFATVFSMDPGSYTLQRPTSR